MTTQLNVPARLGRYRIVKELGSGGMGSVYLAEDSTLGRRVAIKVPHFGAGASADLRDRFLLEARTAASVEHPNLCPIHDVGEESGFLFFVMPFIDGTPLSRLIDPATPWPIDKALALVRKLAGAVQTLHLKGIVHRDLKPANVMMRRGNDPIVMDFGLAKLLTGQGRPLTHEGMTLGTPAYMSPEQVNGDPRAIGPATDIHALGVILYELLSGQRPFEGSQAILLGQVLHAVPPPPSTLRPGLDARLDAICLKALAKKPTERFANMAEFARALGSVAGTAPVPQARSPVEGGVVRLVCPKCGKVFMVTEETARMRIQCPHCRVGLTESDASRTEVLPAPARRGQIRWMAATAAALVLIVGGVIFLTRGSRRDDPAPSPHREPPREEVKNEPKREPPGREILNSLGMKFVVIPPGRFMMGSPGQELGRNENEEMHEVEITQPYYLGIHEVTQEQYDKVMADNPSWFSREGSSKAKVSGVDTKRFPVEYVSWRDALKFCDKLSARPEEKRAGRSYRLPTEAEWERACRGGSTRRGPFGLAEGRPLSPEMANFKVRPEDLPLDRPTNVGSYEANPYGLYDMHGNVWEWCQDGYGPYEQSAEVLKDPAGPKNAEQRVLRGGSWYSRPSSCRSATRYAVSPDQRADDAGFRVVCEVRP